MQYCDYKVNGLHNMSLILVCGQKLVTKNNFYFYIKYLQNNFLELLVVNYDLRFSMKKLEFMCMYPFEVEC